MAKVKKNKRTRQTETPAEQQGLPQNVLPMGESTPSDKKVYISQKAYKTIHNFTKDKTKNESGGILVGRTVEEFGKTHIVISGFVEAKHCEATPTTLTFTHQSWEYIHKEMDKRFPDCSIVGWIHTHPNFGIFLSEYDKFIQENFFQGENQVAYVIDPIQKTEGFYVRLDGRIEKCAGFFIYDEIGKKIDPALQEKAPAEEAADRSGGGQTPWLISGIMLVMMAVLGFMCWKLNSEVNALQAQVAAYQMETYYLMQEVNTLYGQTEKLEQALQALEAPDADGAEPPADPGAAQTQTPDTPPATT